MIFVHRLQELDEAEIEEARRRRQQLENDDSEMYETHRSPLHEPCARWSDKISDLAWNIFGFQPLF